MSIEVGGKMVCRPTTVTIEGKALVKNYREIARRAGSGSPVAPVVKSNAYGHGAVPVARTLVEAGADRLAVSLTGEALELRKSGIQVPLLVLGGSYPGEAREIVAERLTAVVTAKDLPQALDGAAGALGLPARIHVKVETGLGRLGILPSDLSSFLEFLRGLRSVRLEGTCSTFSSVDDLEKAREQLSVFEEAAREAEEQWGQPLLRHIAHSGGMLRGLTRPGWLLRPGILLYGYTRGLEAPGLDLRSVLTWKTEVMKVQEFPAGFRVGYSGLYRTREGSRIALLPVGYSDGLLRSYMGKGEVLIRGKRAPLVGRFSMDWTMAEVGGIPGARAGDEVILIGSQGEERICADEMAERAGTIIDEVFVSIAGRVPRIFSP